MITPDQFMELLAGWRNGNLSQIEREQFSAAIQEGHYSELVQELIEAQLTSGELEGLITVSGQEKGLEKWRKENLRNKNPIPVHRLHFLKRAWFRWAAAIIILFGIGTYIFSLTSQPDKETAKITPSPKSDDILPGYNRAVLTLSDGQKVELDSAASETIKEGSLSIENNNGQLIYKKGDLVAVNTMTTPKGGQYRLTLADGTRVWLNAASSITYPTAFPGKSREVSIAGEAYFEVSPNPKRPFVVKTPKDDITVLGTAFNINAYEEEDDMKTSLVEGLVKVGDTNIKPGEAYEDGNVIQTNIEQDIAWKNGVFDFNNLTLQQAMKQIERWYDIKVKYEGFVPQTQLVGKIDRKTSLKGLLKGMEGMVGRFRLEGNVLFVRSL